MDPLESEFQKIYDFYLDTLKLNEYYGIKPVYFFFRNDTRPNAKAGRSNKNFVIAINSGTIFHLHKKFSPGEINLISTKINLDENVIGTDSNTLIYQFALHFTFYHELGHLIQMSEISKNGFVKLFESKSIYSERKHLEEFDADTFSAISLASHVIQLYENNYSAKVNSLEFKKLMIAMCSAGINYILSFNGVQKKMYYFENTHPHPIIRITCILDHFLGYCQDYFGIGFFTNDLRADITVDAFNTSSKIFDAKSIENFKKQYSENSKGIRSYLHHFRKLEENDESLAIYKRNKFIES
jgi:hypothetical protein